MKSPWLALSLILTAFPAMAAEPLYVAVGYGGRRMTSRDGQTWENVQQWSDKGADDSNNLMSIAYGRGKFICVGGGGWSRETQAGHILASSDGREWREVAKYPFRVNPVLFHGNRFIAGGPSRNLLWSEDGEKWSEGPKVEMPAGFPGYAFWFRRGAAGNGVFIFMGNANKDQKTWWCLTTKDGEKIESISFEAPGAKGLAFGGGRFVALNQDAVFTSADGKEWKAVPAAPADEYRGVIWNGRAFIATGKSSTYESTDGVTWKPIGKAPPGNIVAADEHGYISTGWPGKMFYSKDAITWKPTGQPEPGLGVNQIAQRTD